MNEAKLSAAPFYRHSEFLCGESEMMMNMRAHVLISIRYFSPDPLIILLSNFHLHIVIYQHMKHNHKTFTQDNKANNNHNHRAFGWPMCCLAHLSHIFHFTSELVIMNINTQRITIQLFYLYCWRHHEIMCCSFGKWLNYYYRK